MIVIRIAFFTLLLFSIISCRPVTNYFEFLSEAEFLPNPSFIIYGGYSTEVQGRLPPRDFTDLKVFEYTDNCRTDENTPCPLFWHINFPRYARPSQITYGEIPFGAKEVVPAKSLVNTNTRYAIVAHGTRTSDAIAAATFNVDGTGLLFNIQNQMFSSFTTRLAKQRN
jgi:hypothetical protein